MKKAFTMIELVFVIVALGILAMVALPRLASSKEDAEITRVKAEIAAIRSAIQTNRGAKLLAQEGNGYPEKLDEKTIEEIIKKVGYNIDRPIDIAASQFLYGLSATLHSESFAGMSFEEQKKELLTLGDRLFPD